MSVSVRIIVFLLTALLAAACTTSTSGEPSPGATKSISEDGSNRPHEITLEDIDPCALLPETDYNEYHIDAAGKPDQNDQGNKRCFWPTQFGFMSVTLVINEGIEAQQERTNPIEPAEDIKGFPTYTITLSRVDNSCFTAVDVADGQYLFIQAGLYSPDNSTSPCEHSHQFASSLMSTLVS